MSDAGTAISMFDRIGGDVTIDRLVERFYERMDSLPAAAEIRAMHAPDLEPVKKTLKRYLAEWTGGPKYYSSEKGHPRLRQRHLHVSIGDAQRDAWLLCMRAALDEIVADIAARDELYIAMARLADWMRNQAGNPHDARKAAAAN